MAVTTALRRVAGALAAGAAAPVFVAVGAGARDRTEELLLRPELRLVGSPRHASVLLVAGPVPHRGREALARVHDQVPHPRATVRWGTDAPVVGTGPRGGAPDPVPAGEDPVPSVLGLYRALVRHRRPSEPHVLPDEPPAPWRGRGDHGQGGEGMMGGTPYGRPMAMTGPDVRDGLMLDVLELTLGPFFPPFPPGLVLRLALQGDVVQEAEVLEPPYPQPLAAGPARPGDRPAVARARIDLRRVARVLRVAGAAGLADRALAAAVAARPAPAAVRRLRRIARRGGSLAALPVVESGGEPVDVRGAVDRWIQGAEAALAGAVSDADRSPGDAEPPAGGLPDPRASLDRLGSLLPGMEWGDAMVVIAMLDPVPHGPTEAEP